MTNKSIGEFNTLSVRCQNESERIKEGLIKISNDFYETIHLS